MYSPVVELIVFLSTQIYCAAGKENQLVEADVIEGLSVFLGIEVC